MSMLDSIAAEIRHLRDTIRPGFGQFYSARLAYRVTKQEYAELVREMDALRFDPRDRTEVSKLSILGMRIEPTYDGVADSESYYADCDLRARVDRRRGSVDSHSVVPQTPVGLGTDGGGPT